MLGFGRADRLQMLQIVTIHCQNQIKPGKVIRMHLARTQISQIIAAPRRHSAAAWIRQLPGVGTVSASRIDEQSRAKASSFTQMTKHTFSRW
jgi:hypothetical protein